MKTQNLFFALFAFLALASFTHAFDISSGKGSTAYGDYYSTSIPANAWDSDNSTASEWTTNNAAATERNNTVDLNGTYTYSVTSCMWRSYDGTATYTYGTLRCYYSNDNSTFFLAGSSTGTTGNRIINFTAIQARYWRIGVTAPTGDGVYGYTSYAGIYGTIYTASDAVTIQNPTNTTFVNASVTAQAVYTNAQNFAGQCFQASDSTYSNLGIFQPNEVNSREVTGTSIGAHTLNITCSKHAPYNASIDAPTEEGTGSTTYDLMMNSNFTLGSGVSWAGTANAPNGFGNALNFTSDTSGASSTVNPASGQANFTMGAWFYGNSNCGTGWNCNNTLARILDSDALYIALSSNTTGSVSCQASNASSTSLSVSTSSGFSKKKWNRIDCVFSNDGTRGNVTIYVNGAYNSSNTATGFGNIKTTVNPFRIGQSNSLIRSWDGMMAKVTAFNRILNATEILGLYTLGTSGYTNATSSISYSRLDWLVQGNIFTTPVYEVSNNTLGGSINTTSNIAIRSAGLYYNGTSLTSLNTSVTQTGFQSNTTYSFTVPVLQVNNTNASFYWSFNLSWTNGTTIIVNTTSSTQANIFAYTPGTFYLSSTNTSESQPINATLTVVNYSSVATVSVIAYLNSSVYGTATQSNTNYTASLTTPSVGTSSVTLYPYAVLNVSYGGVSRTTTSSNLTLTVSQLAINNCSSSTNYLLNFTFKDEESLASLNGTMLMAINITTPSGIVSRTFNFSFVNVTTATVCAASPGFYYANSVQDYSGSYNASYPPRHYYLANASLNTTTTTAISLYLLSSSPARLTQFYLTNGGGVAQSGLTIVATRYYPGLDEYLTVGMAKTGSEGTTGIYLRPNDAQHRFFVYSDADYVEAFSPQYVTGDPAATLFYVSLILSSDPLQRYTTLTETLSRSCSEVNGAGGFKNFTCVYSDTTGSMSTIYLRAYLIGNLINTTLCSDSSTSASGVLTCQMGNMTNKLAYAWMEVGHSPTQFAGGWYVGEGWESPDYLTTGTSVGLWTSIVMLLVLTGISLFSPAAAIFMSVIVIAGMWSLGLLAASWPAIVGLIIAAVILAYRLGA